MNDFLEIPLESVIRLTPERAVSIIRVLLRAECRYCGLGPDALTISSRITIADGGIDAQVEVPSAANIPMDCLFKEGLTGFQIKSGTAFKPWTSSSIRAELLGSSGNLFDEVRRLVERRGRYTILCTGHDLTVEQRNAARSRIIEVLAEAGITQYENLVDVLGASQVADFSERYPRTAFLLAGDQVLEGLTLDVWQQDSQLGNDFKGSTGQIQVIDQIRTGILGEAKHIRILGEPGLGKTRIVLEALKENRIAPTVLYFQHGSRFSQTRLFHHLLKNRPDKPLVLVIDELPETEMAEVWRHLKLRCGHLKIVSLDHGKDESYDPDIQRFEAPTLTDDVIKKILIDRIGDSRDIDRWVGICEGSPRVALAVTENLRANPDDLLKPPATIQLWDRFLHAYGRREIVSSRQVDCVVQHLALFTRFGFEAPVSDEAEYISGLVQKVDPTIGWARFQEIVMDLRSRRVLQGSSRLFFVPKLLHIYLWKRFWVNYGRSFDFIQTLTSMPESLHAWFMNMFKYAGGAATDHVIGDILRADGIFSERSVFSSDKGSRFLSILAEANPAAVLILLESTFGTWSDEEILNYKHERQNLVWTLEKIAVWKDLTVRAIRLFARLAVNENAGNSNNATGTLIGLFRIGPEYAATESSPQTRLPAILRLLRSPLQAERDLGLKAMQGALDSDGSGSRILGPEYQGLKGSAKLWIPQTYEDWRQCKYLYFKTLVSETGNWPPERRTESAQTLLNAVQKQIKVQECTELAFQVLESFITDGTIPASKLNDFFVHWQEYKNGETYPNITKRIRALERRFVTRDLASRFQRYVVDMKWAEWDEEYRAQRQKPKGHGKALVGALAARIAKNPGAFQQIRHLLSSSIDGVVVWEFGRQLAFNDTRRTFLQPLIEKANETKNPICLHGYLSTVLAQDPQRYYDTMAGFFNVENNAWLGVTIALRSEYNDKLFGLCLDALDKKWVEPSHFDLIRYGRAVESIPGTRVSRLLHQLSDHSDPDALFLVNEMLYAIPFNESSPFESGFVFGVIFRTIPNEERRGGMTGHYWNDVCEKLIAWDPTRAIPLLDILLTAMAAQYRLSYDFYAAPTANRIVKANPSAAWKVIAVHIEQSLPKWRTDILQWLKGGLTGYDDETPHGASSDIPIADILAWIEVDVATRASFIAHAAPRTLDDEGGGALTRILLQKYGQVEGVQSGISAIFGSGGWTGPTSLYYRSRRDKFRTWLSAGFEIEVVEWIDKEIEYLNREIEREETNEERSRFD